MQPTEAKKLLARLTTRQRDILEHIASGDTGKDIATKLGITLSTVDTHRSAVMDRLCVSTIAHAVGILAESREWTPPSPKATRRPNGGPR